VVNKYLALISDRERTYSERNLIEHGEVPGEKYAPCFSFVQNLPRAKMISTGEKQIYEQIVEINSIPRQVIIALPPTKITYAVPVEQKTLLAFAIGILPGAWDKIPQGVKFDIVVSAEGESDTIFSRVLMPKRNIGDRGWHNFLIPLTKFWGKTVSLSFRTSGAGEDLSYCWSAWGWGQIVKSRDVMMADPGSHKDIPDAVASDIHEERFGNKWGEIVRVDLLDADMSPTTIFKSGDRAIIRITIVLNEDIAENLTVGCTIKNKYCDVYGTNTLWPGIDIRNRKKGEQIIIEFSQNLILNSGTYSINAGLVIARSDTEIEVLDRRYDHLVFQVINAEKMVGIVDLHATVKEILG
jgi:hypothetical protein